jgi:hypothetical protein
VIRFFLLEWGAKIIERVSKDIIFLFPDISGFSCCNLYFMRQFAEEYPDVISETAVSQIPWDHNIILFKKIDTLSKSSGMRNKPSRKVGVVICWLLG